VKKILRSQIFTQEHIFLNIILNKKMTGFGVTVSDYMACSSTQCIDVFLHSLLII